MGLILIHSERFSGEREFARSVAEHLGYRLITRDVVIERAAAWGGSHGKLARILVGRPGLRDRLLRGTFTQLLFLRAVIAEEIRDGNTVCYGELADVVLQDDIPAFRIQIRSSPESRINTVSRLLKLSKPEAADFLKHADRARKAWLRLIYGSVRAEAAADLVINLERLDIPQACDTVAGLVRRAQDSRLSFNRFALHNLAVSTRVRAKLAADSATAHLELAVKSQAGRVSISGALDEARDSIAVRRVARSVHGVSEIVLNGEALGETEVARLTDADRRSAWRWLRPAFSALALAAAALTLYSGLAGRLGTLWGHKSETILGVVTDSRCGLRHEFAETEQCVRACVAKGSKYVLDDGKRLYEFSDQRIAEGFAARKVRVKGALQNGSRYLKVASIEPLKWTGTH